MSPISPPRLNGKPEWQSIRRITKGRHIIGLLGLLLPSIPGCNQSNELAREPVPDHYGLFFVINSELKELNPLSHARVSQTSEGTGAIEFDSVPNILAGAGGSFVSYGFDGAVLARAVEPGQSRRFRVGEIVALDVQLISGKRDMQRLTPRVPLSRGAYMLSVRGCMDNSWNRRCYYPFVAK